MLLLLIIAILVAKLLYELMFLGTWKFSDIDDIALNCGICENNVNQM